MTLVTPTGVLLPTAAEPHTPGWYAMRRQGITATDLPKILGLSKYGNALSVWNDKRAKGNDEAGEAARWGLVLEEPIAQRWAEDNGASVEPVGTLANVDEPWMLASLDRLVLHCPGETAQAGHISCGLEIKTRSAFVAGKWKEDVPDDVLAQVQWQLMVSGLPHAHVACLFGGQKLATYTVARDKELEAYLFAAALPVWQAIKSGTPPEVTADDYGVLLAELNRMFAEREGTVQVDLDKAEPLIRAYNEGHRREGEGTAIKTRAKTQMVAMMGGAAVAAGNSLLDTLWTYKPQQAHDTMTADDLARLRRDHPILYQALVANGYITKTSTNPKFHLKK